MVTEATTRETLAQLSAEIEATPHNPRALAMVRRSFAGSVDLIVLSGSREACLSYARALVGGQGWTLFGYQTMHSSSTVVLHFLKGTPHAQSAPAR